MSREFRPGADDLVSAGYGEGDAVDLRRGGSDSDALNPRLITPRLGHQ